MNGFEDRCILNIHSSASFKKQREIQLLTRPMLPDGVNPNPPIRPAHMSDKMSPYKLGITMTRSE